MRHSALLIVALALLAPSVADANPVALSRDDVAGLSTVRTTPSLLRGALLGAMRGGPRPAIRAAPARASAFRLGTGRLLTGSVVLRSDRVAMAVQKAARSRTRLGKKSSAAIVVVRVGASIGVVSLTAKGRDTGIGKTAAAYAATLKARLAYEERFTVADRLGDNGDWTKNDALALFKLAYGTMPGAKIPAGNRGVVNDGTVAMSRVLRILPQLTPAQRAAFERVTSGPDAAARATGRRAHTAANPKLVPDPAFQTIAQELIPLYEQAGRFGRPLGYPVKVFKALGSIDATADAFPVDAKGKLAQTNPAYCRIRLGPPQYKRPATFQRFVIAHELFHCFEFSITTNWGYKGRDWVIEGMADWGASQIVADPSGRSESTFAGYLMTPQVPLFKRAYSAVGFWGQVHERFGSFWTRAAATLQAGDNEATYDTAGGTNPDVASTEASRFERDPGPGAGWNTLQPFVIAPVTAPTPHTPTGAAVANLSVAAHADKLANVLPTPSRPVVEITRSEGNVRFTDGSSDFPDADQTFFCLGGKCECQDDEVSSLPSPLPNVSQLEMALAGGKAGTKATIRRHQLKEYCKPDKKPPASGPSGPGGSNGDPHLTSLDGLRFDFQAAGEFVLLRSNSGDMEVQARQEPWKFVRTITINTQLGFRIAGRRVTVTPGKTMELDVNGVPQRVTPGSPLTLGAATIAASDADLLLTWPDGSTADVQPVGLWGVAVTIDLAPGRVNKVKGLLGDFDHSPLNDLTARNGAVVKFTPTQADWPGVNRVHVVNEEKKSFQNALYDTFGDSWRVKQSDSLLGYGPGETTATFTDRTIPRNAVQAGDFSAAKRAKAEAICRAAGVTAPAALEDCILDVIITGRVEFAAAAAAEEALVAVNWTKLAAGSDRRGPVSLARRPPDPALHLAWEDRNGTSSRIVHERLPDDGGELGPTLVEPFDTTPYLFAAPEGLRVVGSVIDVPTGVEGITQFGSVPPYSTWDPRPLVTGKGFSYVGEPMAVVVDGTLFTVNGQAGRGRVYRGESPTNDGFVLNGALSPACYATKPAIAASGTTIIAAWYQWDCPQTGVYVATIDPATGAPGIPTEAPQSLWTSSSGPQTWDSIALDRMSLVARPGGGIYLAYARQDGDQWSVLLWTVGTPAPMVVASKLTKQPDSLQVSAEPTTGNLWVAWESQDVLFGEGKLAVRRTNAAATGWLSGPRTVRFPAGAFAQANPVHPWDVFARDGGLDVIAGYPRVDETTPGGLWHAVVPG